jgi:serine/threonine protein kinase
VKVLDFGIAKMADEDARAGNLTIDGGILGTPVYMAPERFRGEPIDGAVRRVQRGRDALSDARGGPPVLAPDAT